MAIAPEKVQFETEQFTEIPPVGSAEHINYLSQLKFPDAATPDEVTWFLVEHHAAPSISAFIRYHQTPYEVGGGLLTTLDSRILNHMNLTGPLTRASILSDARGDMLTIHSEPGLDSAGPTYDVLLQAHRGGYLKSVFNPMLEASIIEGQPFFKVMVPNPHKPGEEMEAKQFNPDYQPQVYRPYISLDLAEHDSAIFAEAFTHLMADLYLFSQQFEAKKGSVQALRRAMGHILWKQSQKP